MHRLEALFEAILSTIAHHTVAQLFAALMTQKRRMCCTIMSSNVKVTSSSGRNVKISHTKKLPKSQCIECSIIIVVIIMLVVVHSGCYSNIFLFTYCIFSIRPLYNRHKTDFFPMNECEKTKKTPPPPPPNGSEKFCFATLRPHFVHYMMMWHS